MATRSTIDAPKTRKKRLDEFSKLSFAALELVGVGNLIAYWVAVFAGLAPEPVPPPRPAQTSTDPTGSTTSTSWSRSTRSRQRPAGSPTC